ncbi:DEAD/DEAH box helicase [Microvirga lotononidis]|uniref:DNA/RNA helicase, superfamily II n=1 Tax=Microvirga lotononidis TaxID=864069 RepID=I4YTB8_9HYPH|nr:DEAD/DEAH box helicase family protein [Microvirga lotononidis]EIM27210.1 DNA/RNA helicase, superfamily II [Microvirga lotononidis]WQO28611.1 DEAD/DEAH box helicase family protein [Microvirga lotononidis]
MTIRLRPWQDAAVRKALTWLTETRQDRHFLINAAPGAGKTICASMIARRLIEMNEIDRVIIIAPRAEVVRQWAEEFKFVTGRPVTRVTGADGEVDDYGTDLCATWAAIQGLQDAFQQVCMRSNTLIICDEHHHAAVQASWGTDADSAFAEAKYALILTGTPIRSDGQESVWLAFDSHGRIDHPEAGSYTLTYGEAVSLGYCRPITFHRHEGRFSVVVNNGEEAIAVSGTDSPSIPQSLKGIKGLQQALDFFKLACTPKYLPDGVTPDTNSYQASMLEWGISKLNDLRDTVPNAGGLIIAPSIPVAQYMADLLEILDGEKPVLVHSQLPNAEARIASFKNTNKRWLVSVSMISEGVDIKRLRVLVYLPYAQTELAFRQAMGRVVRSLGDDDYSRAYVVMPTHRILEEYARRVEMEMRPADRVDESRPRQTKLCGVCGAENPKTATSCSECGNDFPARSERFKTCEDCGQLNPISADSCQNCGASFRAEYDITLNEALRLGAIVRGMDLDEDEVRASEANKTVIIDQVLRSGDDLLINLIKQVPEEGLERLRRILNRD